MAREVKGIDEEMLAALIKASEQLTALTNVQVVGDKIILVDSYKLKDNSDDAVVFSLLFYNIAVIVSTDVYVERKLIFDDVVGSINEFELGANSRLKSKTLDIFSSAAVSKDTKPLPAEFKAALIINGGKGKVVYPLSGIKLTDIGQIVELELSIYFY